MSSSAPPWPGEDAQLAHLVGDLVVATDLLSAIGAALALAASEGPAPRGVRPALDELTELLGLAELMSQLGRDELQGLADAIGSRLARAHDFAVRPARAPAGRADPDAAERLAIEALAPIVSATIAHELPALARRLRMPGVRLLDVGSGVAAFAIALCRAWPHASVVSIDVARGLLAEERERVRLAGLADRIELRAHDPAELTDREAFDLVLVRMSRLRSVDVAAALGRCLDATRPTGWIAAAVAGGATPLSAALARLQAARAGGSPMSLADAEDVLRATGWEDVRSLRRETLPAAWIVVGRRAP